MSKEENVISLSDSLRSLKHLFTKLRDVKTNCVEFKVAASRVMTLIWQDIFNYSIYVYDKNQFMKIILIIYRSILFIYSTCIVRKGSVEYRL
jgi:hypothetical protein